MSEHPEIQWALDLLAPDPNFKPGVMKEYATDVGCMALGVGMVTVANLLRRRPLHSGIHAHVGSLVAGYIIAQYIKRGVDNYQAERDSRLRDYVIRHPELFPEPERVKYKDVVYPWYPTR